MRLDGGKAVQSVNQLGYFCLVNVKRTHTESHQYRNQSNINSFVSDPPFSKNRKPYGFLIFSKERGERVHWEQMG